ncbi:MAG: DUF2497 domain-containing protein, partial [Planctomycetaceae bacterium]|nr:DUF2497 domain-containing protein [Planctomycetaceae bacterium]
MTQDQPQAKKKRSCLRGCSIACLLAIVALVLLVSFNIPTPMRISEETTRILGPMMPDGKRIDYFRAMEERFYPPELATDDNGYRLLLQAFGVNAWKRESGDPTMGEILALATASPRLQIYEKLGLDPNDEPTTPLKIESPRSLLDDFDKFSALPFWILDDYPMLKDWLDENTPGIDVLAEAVRKPVFFIPIVHADESPLAWNFPASGMLFQGWAQAVHARATYRLGIGDIDGAMDDLVTLHRFGRHTGNQITLLFWVLGRYGEALGSTVDIGSHPEFPPTKAQIERLVTELHALPPRQPFAEVI